MFSCFSYFELNVHAPFYNKLNEVLGLADDDFYNSYLESSTLSERMEFIKGIISGEEDLKSIAVFSLIEGAILYSSFAFLKHFQAEGKNKLMNVCSGINFSVNDELLHAQAGAWLFRTLQEEMESSDEDRVAFGKELEQCARDILEHEKEIIAMLFEKGRIEGITEKQLSNFVESRLDICLEQLGYEKIFKPSYNPIANWFYTNINAGQFTDFFTRVGSEYNKNWSESKFKW